MPQLDEDSIQGNILKGFARNYGLLFFVRFRGDAGVIRPALGRLLTTYVTSASGQAAITETWKETNQSAGVGMFGLSWAGYRRLSLTAAVDVSEDLGGPLFQRGMKNAIYFDPMVQQWDAEYQTDLDAFILLADSDLARLQDTGAALRTDLGPIADIAAEESAARLFDGPDSNRFEIEHFGFHDGISTPPDPGAVLTPEPNWDGSAQPAGHGCYAAFMKLEQDVAGFRSQSDSLAGLVAGATSEQVQALAVGRQKDGQPLVPYGADFNDFTFVGTPPGKCPLQSHIRVMNPRNGTETRNILRRSLTYGPPRLDLNDADAQPPSAGSGLLFLSFQRRLLDFMFLHQRSGAWQDPILSRREAWRSEGLTAQIRCIRDGNLGQSWPIQGSEVCFSLADLTTLKGAEFFYIPSMRFIRALAGL